MYRPERVWTDEQAKEHQQASATFHELQHTVGGQLNRKGSNAAKTKGGPTKADLDAVVRPI